MHSDLPAIRTPLPGPNARAVIERDRAVLSPSYTRSYPLVAARGEGAIVEDVDGNRFLDFNAGIAVAATGHCHPKVVEAIQRQSARLIHMSGTDFYYECMVELAEKLAALAPGDMPRRVYFGNSGAEAVEAAIKLARYHTGREKLIAFYGGFHGRTMGALSLTASKAVQRRGFGPLVPGVFHAPYPDLYRQGADEASAASIAAIERIFQTVAPPEEVAAIIVEPVQGEGGYIVPPQRFFHDLQALARRHDILLIADEVQSGMGRTGRIFASEHFGFVPDIITSAKGIASGMPISAMIARAEIMRWTPGAHASTFGGNPVACAAALATIELLESGLTEQAARTGEYLMARLKTWPDRFPNVAEVRGLGLMIGIELVEDQTSKQKKRDLRDKVVQLAFERGLLVLGAGESAIRLSPPLIITEQQADFAVRTLEECLTIADNVSITVAGCPTVA
ncbi:MAG TPA: acetyl ornithine aminotransferase family protein [Bryobacteraceae bacterium]|nr:acetyl ornithine aminotransferase family protein [Bryobacteraceae bacterium]